MGNDTVVVKLAKFCTGLRFDELDKEVVEKIKQLVIDQLAVEVACAALPWNKSLYEYVRMLDARGKSTVVDYGLKTNVENAVLANSTFGHGFEIDDVDLRGGPTGHPGSLTVPVAIALAETRPVFGKRMIEAVVSGYEVLSAIARGIQPSSHFSRGFHAQGSGGPFASAAVAGVIRGQDVPTLANTFSLAASHAGGIMEYANTGGSVKRLHAGLAAMGGVRSATLSELGWTGPPTAIEGKRGFCVAFAQEYNIEAITRDLGKKFSTPGTIIKPYSCNANITPAIDALKAVLAEAPLMSKDIEAIEVYTSSRAMKSAGGIGPEPEDKVGAQFSMHFSLAMTLVKGSNDFHALLEADLKDPELIGAAKKVKLIPDKEGEEKIEKGQPWARVTVVTKDGRRFSSAQFAKGTPENPLSQEEVEKKARSLTLKAMGSIEAERLIDLCRHLEELKDVSELARCMTKS